VNCNLLPAERIIKLLCQAVIICRHQPEMRTSACSRQRCHLREQPPSNSPALTQRDERDNLASRPRNSIVKQSQSLAIFLSHQSWQRTRVMPNASRDNLRRAKVLRHHAGRPFPIRLSYGTCHHCFVCR
jgi:hypothetical protein